MKKIKKLLIQKKLLLPIINIILLIITAFIIYWHFLSRYAQCRKFKNEMPYYERVKYCMENPLLQDVFWKVILIVLLLAIVILLIIIIKNHKKEKKDWLLLIINIMILVLGIAGIIMAKPISEEEANSIYGDWANTIDKPILYLYPEKEEKVTVTFEHPENLLTTYPKYKNNWTVTASSNGDLYAKNGKYYYALYWDEKNTTTEDFKEGFYVTKENAIEFLETTLTQIGLTEREQNEFIMYWLPILEKNEQSIVNYTLTEERQNENKLIITPQPDSLLRIRINIKKVNQKVNIKEQKLPTFTREGFTVVEWGGAKY